MNNAIKEQWRINNKYIRETFIAYRFHRTSNQPDNSHLHPMFRYFTCQYVFNDDLLYHGKLNNG